MSDSSVAPYPALRCEEQVESVLVVRRKDNGQLACIGGFVEVGETLEDATRREVKEETGLDVTSLQMLPKVSREEAAAVCACGRSSARARRLGRQAEVFHVCAYSSRIHQFHVRTFRVNLSVAAPADAVVADCYDEVGLRGRNAEASLVATSRKKGGGAFCFLVVNR